MSKHIKFLKRSVLTLAAVMLVLPFVAKAEDFGSVEISKKGKVTLTAQASGFATKGGSVDAPPNTLITLTWTIPDGWKGCYSNWQAAMIAVTDPKTKTAFINNTAFPRGRIFGMTCFGVGQAQTVAVKVNIVKPDISIARFSAIGKKLIPAAVAVKAKDAILERKDTVGQVIQPAVPAVAPRPAILKNTYEAGPGAITFSAVVKNSGRTSVPATPPITVSYQALLYTPILQTTYKSVTKVPDAKWNENNMRNVNLEGGFAIAPGAMPNVSAYSHETSAGGPWYFRVWADNPSVVDESNESNNKTVAGPYYFR